MVDAVVAGVRLHAEWVGPLVPPGSFSDVELDIDDPLVWGDRIALPDGASSLRDGPLLRGTVEAYEEPVLTLRITEGLVMVEFEPGPVDVPPGTAVVVVAEHPRLFPTGI